jgi:hypothetical protein
MVATIGPGWAIAADAFTFFLSGIPEPDPDGTSGDASRNDVAS